MNRYEKPKRWGKKESCYETKFDIFEYVVKKDITKSEAKGIISMLCKEWFGEDKGHVINSIIEL